MISVILPVISKKYLKESVDSILNQTYKNFELIVILEKSSEQIEIEKLLNKYSDKRIIIMKNNKKLGLAKSLNIGLEKSKGKYIARMDSDDVSLENRLEIEYNYMEKHNDVDILATNAEYFGNVNGPWFNGNISFENLKSNLLISNPICHPTVMFRKSSIKKYNLKYNSKYISEDYELWCDSISKGCTINVLEDITLKYRKSTNNLTSNDKLIKARINSVVKTLKKYYFKTLKLRMSKSSIMNMQILFPYNKNNTKREKLIIKIVEKNKIVKFYNEEELTWQLGYYNIIENQKH